MQAAIREEARGKQHAELAVMAQRRAAAAAQAELARTAAEQVTHPFQEQCSFGIPGLTRAVHLLLCQD